MKSSLARRVVAAAATLMASPSLASADVCQDEHEARLAECQTMPTIPRLVCVVVSNEMLEECLDTQAATDFGSITDEIIERMPGVGTIDIELVELSLQSIDLLEVEILPGNGDPKFSLDTDPTPNGFSFDLDDVSLAPYFEDGFIVSMLAFDDAGAFVAGGAFVVPSPPGAAVLTGVGLLAARRRR